MPHRVRDTKPNKRSPLLPLFWHCDFPQISFRTVPERVLGNQPSMVLAENPAHKGLAMLIRSEKHEIPGEAARAVGSRAIPAVPTLLIGGLLLLIGP
jgi:hypothetical protein